MPCDMVEGTARSMGLEVEGLDRAAVSCQLRGKSNRSSATAEAPTADNWHNMAKQSKRFRALADKHPARRRMPVDRGGRRCSSSYDSTKFDQSVDIAIRLGIDHEQADQIVRGSIVLPHGIGK